MPYCDNRGVRIHYEVAGDPAGPALVLQHGFSMSLTDWYEAGYVAALGATHRLILIDARGHGASDKPRDPDAYQAPLRAADVVAVLDDLDLDRAHYFGYSMGAAIGFMVAAHAPERFRSLIFGGGTPVRPAPGTPDRLTELLQGGLDSYVAGVTQMFGPRMTPALRGRMQQNDAAALLASRLTERPDHEGALAAVAVPCLFFLGDADQPGHDQAKAYISRMARASFVSLPGPNHVEGFYRIDLTVPYLLAFLATAP